MGKKRVLLKDVLSWLREAMRAAKADPGDGDGATTALSYRKLAVDITIETGGVTVVFVRTRNDGFIGGRWHYHRALTADGVIVKWEEQDLGIPTGADWLPREFVEWMRGG
jgi:hypothetical protein